MKLRAVGLNKFILGLIITAFSMTFSFSSVMADSNKTVTAQATSVAKRVLPDEKKGIKKKITAKMLKPFANLSRESATCVSCHREKTPGIYQQWGSSKHHGANVGCYECHKAKKSDKDAIRHKDFIISVIVSPKDCGQCHNKEVEEFSKSHHARAAEIIGSLDNVLAEVVEGNNKFRGFSAVAANGCWQCHGSPVKVLPNGDLDPATWPNSGIGRINPDGSRGSCTACHQRHKFSLAQARRPESCGKCHLGPDHPQKEIYDSSKHGIAFYGNVKHMNLSSSKWVVGEDYSAAPTCATCHMSATKNQPITHDVGSRISWTLRPPISEKVDAKAIKKGLKVKSWLARRKDMKDVCRACHASNVVENFYMQFDALVNLYNNKFAIPGSKLMKLMKKEKLISSIPFDDKIEWTWFYLWHHEGRRARHGAAMQGPDYTHWHGMFEVAHRFYIEMIPEIRKIIKKSKAAGKVKGAKKLEALLNKILSSPNHRWFIGKMSPAEALKRKASRAAFKKRYLQKE